MSISTKASAGFACAREFGEARADLLARGRLQGDHHGIAARALQAGIDVFGPHLEALVVIGLAAQAGDSQIEGGGGRAQRGGHQQHGQLHTTPHFRRSSHSEARMPSTSRKTIGISHKSRVSRVVMPASEYEISLASLAASAGV